MPLAGPFSSGIAAGSAGTATANLDSTNRLNGKVVGIYVLYNDSPPAGTTDVVIKTKGTSPAPPTYNLLSLANAATDGWFYPQIQVHTVAGSLISAEYTSLLVHDLINVSIAGADAADSVTVWLLLSPIGS